MNTLIILDQKLILNQYLDYWAQFYRFFLEYLIVKNLKHESPLSPKSGPSVAFRTHLYGPDGFRQHEDGSNGDSIIAVVNSHSKRDKRGGSIPSLGLKCDSNFNLLITSLVESSLSTFSRFNLIGSK